MENKAEAAAAAAEKEERTNGVRGFMIKKKQCSLNEVRARGCVFVEESRIGSNRAYYLHDEIERVIRGSHRNDEAEVPNRFPTPYPEFYRCGNLNIQFILRQ